MSSATPPPPQGPGDPQQPGATGGPPPPPPGQPGVPPPQQAGQPQYGQPPATHAAGVPADVGKRVGADVIDGVALVIISVILGIIFVAIGIGGGTMGMFTGADTIVWSLLLAIVSVVVQLAYWVGLEGTRGQSLGKMLLGLKVVYTDGRPMDPAGAFKRRIPFYAPALLAWIPILGLLFSLVQLVAVIAGLVTYITDQPNHMGFHDKWANTIVVQA